MKLEDLKWAVGQLAHAFRDKAQCDCPAHRRIAWPQQDAAPEKQADAHSGFRCDDSTSDAPS